MPINYMLIDLLLKIDEVFHDEWKLKTFDGKNLTALDLAIDLKNRLTSMFAQTGEGRPIYGDNKLLKDDEFQRYLQFFEYFNPDTGQGLGASHQTGWTALIANIIIRCSRARP